MAAKVRSPSTNPIRSRARIYTVVGGRIGWPPTSMDLKKRGKVMARIVRLSAPKQFTFLVSLIVAIVALISFLVKIPNVSPHAFWIAMVAYVVLAVGCALKGV